MADLLPTEEEAAEIISDASRLLLLVVGWVDIERQGKRCACAVVWDLAGHGGTMVVIPLNFTKYNLTSSIESVTFCTSITLSHTHGKATTQSKEKQEPLCYSSWKVDLVTIVP